jgi:16S rRNA (cytidine1402-2'-O)-methyltransferase
LIFLETPHRLLDSLRDIQGVLGNRRISVARELTKLHEEIWRGTIAAALRHFDAPRGEFVLVMEGNRELQDVRWTEQQVLGAILDEMKAGATPSALAARLADKSGWRRREIYALTLSHATKRTQ